jgi:hypothetical protein
MQSGMETTVPAAVPESRADASWQHQPLPALHFLYRFLLNFVSIGLLQSIQEKEVRDASPIQSTPDSQDGHAHT